ncbi:K319L protein, partial [Polypterus senegalus]
MSSTELNQPPVAKISGSIVVTLPVNTAVLDGSKSTDDKGIVSYLWTRDEASPAAGVSGLLMDFTLTEQNNHKFGSTQIVFFVRNGPGHPPLKGSEVALMLRSKLWKQKADFFIFRARQVDTVACQRNCSEHGHCDSFTKHCVCDPFWMENLLRVQLGDGESNCDWSVLYVSIAFFLIVVTAGVLAWGAVCCCRRRKGKSKRKSKYKILNGTDDQESMQLKPASKGGGRLKSPTQMHTSLMHSDSELDSDETIFTWPDREKGKVLRNENGSVRNGQGPLKGIKQTREELL